VGVKYSKSVSLKSIGRFLRRMARDQFGATMLEFSLVALPFLLLLMGTFEVGFIYWATKELENATSFGARFIRTGEAQAGNWNQAQLKTRICSQTALLIGCESRLRLDVRSAATFTAFAPLNPVNGGGTLKADNEFSFQPGAGNDVVLVTTFYDWKTMLGGDYVVRAAAPLRNEPF
jgi:Flp pilus assembly protein TadG